MTAFKPLTSWYAIAPDLGYTSVATIKAAIHDPSLGRAAPNVRQTDEFLRSFIAWLLHLTLSEPSTDADLQADAVDLINALNGTPSKQPVISARLIVNLIARWADARDLSGRFSPTTNYNAQRNLGLAFEYLGLCGKLRLPKFERKWIRAGSPPRRSGVSLGDLAWPELEGLVGAHRERLALTILRTAYLSEFFAYEGLAIFGRGILHGQHPLGANRATRDWLKSTLKPAADLILLNKGFPPLGTGEHPVLDPAFWTEAGLLTPLPNAYQVQSKLGVKSRRANLLLSCLGPTSSTTVSAFGVLNCDTGWNRSTLRDMADDPYVFAADGQRGISSNEFLQSFKGRAGREVLAYLEEEEILEGPRLDRLLSLWTETISAEDPNNSGDGYAKLDEMEPDRISSLKILDRYNNLATPLRSVAAEPGYYWYNILGDMTNCRNEAITRLQLDPLYNAFYDHPIIGRDGVNNSAIRKTVLTRLIHGAASFWWVVMV